MPWIKNLNKKDALSKQITSNKSCVRKNLNTHSFSKQQVLLSLNNMSFKPRDSSLDYTYNMICLPSEAFLNPDSIHFYPYPTCYNQSTNHQQDFSIQLAIAKYCLGSNFNVEFVLRIKNILQFGYRTINLYTLQKKTFSTSCICTVTVNQSLVESILENGWSRQITLNNPITVGIMAKMGGKSRIISGNSIKRVSWMYWIYGWEINPSQKLPMKSPILYQEEARSGYPGSCHDIYFLLEELAYKSDWYMLPAHKEKELQGDEDKWNELYEEDEPDSAPVFVENIENSNDGISGILSPITLAHFEESQ
ncbi:hypothetical protein VP01_1162g12 [Puccinia sorghi]|uniref:Uncharacterized protein n=1 Tax=Puccinia sorghi TaxID=27349 RepID=A0A0L6VRG1_9BASI|nr:hypothetical protein VP01_1162g12 [Puccinia sorghi]